MTLLALTSSNWKVCINISNVTRTTIRDILIMLSIMKVYCNIVNYTQKLFNILL